MSKKTLKPGISVIVCSYNGSLKLPQTLAHLARQQVPQTLYWEVIVVDNASTDGTAAVARREWDKYPVASATFSILNEALPGKNNAFRTGLAAAAYDYVLTCDDDNWLLEGYIARAFLIMEADPMTGALGGYGIFEPEQPFNTEVAPYSSMYVNGSQTWAPAEHWVYGAGSVYRKRVLNELFEKNWQQITTGRKNNSLICGEDVEICFMIFLCGYKIIADDDLKFRHFVQASRQQIGYITRLSFWLSYSHVLLNSYFPILNQDKRAIHTIINNWLFGATKTLLKNTFLIFFKWIRKKGRLPPAAVISYRAMLGTWCALLLNRRRIISHHHHTKKTLLPQNGST